MRHIKCNSPRVQGAEVQDFKTFQVESSVIKRTDTTSIVHVPVQNLQLRRCILRGWPSSLPGYSPTGSFAQSKATPRLVTSNACLCLYALAEETGQCWSQVSFRMRKTSRKGSLHAPRDRWNDSGLTGQWISLFFFQAHDSERGDAHLVSWPDVVSRDTVVGESHPGGSPEAAHLRLVETPAGMQRWGGSITPPILLRNGSAEVGVIWQKFVPWANEDYVINRENNVKQLAAAADANPSIYWHCPTHWNPLGSENHLRQ